MALGGGAEGTALVTSCVAGGAQLLVPITCTYAEYGGIAPRMQIVNASMAALAPDSRTDGCSALTGALDSTSIAVVQRGGCSFATKAESAQLAGYAALVIVDSPANSELGAPAFGDVDIEIPVVMISSADGDRLDRAQTFSMSQSGGDCVSADSAAPPSSGVVVDIAVSQFKEDLSWIVPLFCARSVMAGGHTARTIHVYCKAPGPGTLPASVVRACSAAGVAVLRTALPNVGRESHTYLHHMVHSYDELADVTLFLPGSVAEMDTKRDKLSSILAAISASEMTCGWPQRSNESKSQLVSWAGRSKANNPGMSPDALVAASPRPFGRWFEHHVNPEHRSDFFTVCFEAVLSVPRARLLLRPKAAYAKLLELVSDGQNNEANHYMERSWHELFH